MLHKFFFTMVSILSVPYIAGADTKSVSFLSKDPTLAAQEAKIIDWALSYATKKYPAIKQKIEQEKYIYTEQYNFDPNTIVSPVEEISCLFHLKEKLVRQEKLDDYNFLKQYLGGDTQHGLSQHVTDQNGITRFETDSVLVARGARGLYIEGIKEHWYDYDLYPPVYAQILIEKHKDDHQNKINKEYLLARLHHLCANQKKENH